MCGSTHATCKCHRTTLACVLGRSMSPRESKSRTGLRGDRECRVQIRTPPPSSTVGQPVPRQPPPRCPRPFPSLPVGFFPPTRRRSSAGLLTEVPARGLPVELGLPRCVGLQGSHTSCLAAEGSEVRAQSSRQEGALPSRTSLGKSQCHLCSVSEAGLTSSWKCGALLENRQPSCQGASSGPPALVSPPSPPRSAPRSCLRVHFWGNSATHCVSPQPLQPQFPHL